MSSVLNVVKSGLDIGGSYLMGEGYAKLAGYPRGKVGLVFVVDRVAILAFRLLSRSFIANSDIQKSVGSFFAVMATEWMIARLEKDRCIGNKLRVFLMITQVINLSLGLFNLGKRVAVLQAPPYNPSY